MTPILAFGATAVGWQNFYVLVGTAAATLIGLMFVAVTFGAGLVNASASSVSGARAFIDPPFNHFVHVLVTACVMEAPATGARFLGGVVLIVAVLRTAALVTIRRRMLEAHAKFNDVELSDWLAGVVLPGGAYLVLMGSGVGFVAGYQEAFAGLAVGVVVVLLLGVFGAWELMIWLALTRAKKEQE